MGESSYVIGIKIEGDESQEILEQSQETYINKVLERFHMKNCSPSIALIIKGGKFSLSQCLSNDLKNNMKNISYASIVGSLMYVQVCTRLDITYAVRMLGRYQSNSSLKQWRAAKKVMQYLQKTRDYKLTYRRYDHLDMIGYSNSNFANCFDFRKSTSKYVFLLVEGVISWRSVKQTLVASSTMEVEFVSCFEATSNAIWLRSFILGLQVVDSISKPLRIYCDNFVEVFLAKNNKSGSHSKHINIKY